MNGKITLITPPDFFENENKSILFMHLSGDDQQSISEWLAKSDINENINFYFYDHEIDLPWLFHAVARSEYVFIDLDNLNYATTTLSGYLLGKKHVHFKTNDNSTSAICHFINQNRITNIEKFLERVFNGKI